MQELVVHSTKAQFARRHVSKMAGIGLAALIARVTMLTPARAEKRPDPDDNHDRDDNHDPDDRNCFLKGTKIKTITGAREVETLAIGDLLPTNFNGIQPIQWIGRYKFTRSDTSRPWVRNVLPVRIARSALAPNVPQSDLYLAQPHAIFVDGELVRVESLINGATIALHDSDDLSELEYYHIKLQSHDIIWAEGAPCETLLEVEEGAANFVEYLRIYGAPDETAQPCIPVLGFNSSRSKMKSHLRSALSPLVDRREKIDVIRDRLEERAQTMMLS